MAAPSFALAHPGPTLTANDDSTFSNAPEDDNSSGALHQDTGIPPSHFQCSTCPNAMFSDDYKPVQASLSTGDVYGTKDSIYAVIMEIMKAAGQAVPSPVSLKSRSTMHSRVSSGMKYDRPCIVVQPSSAHAPYTIICLMATYKGSQDLRGLPPVFSHFSIPVHPNPTSIDPLHDHVHSVPEWHRFDQWIFAFQFMSKRVLKTKRWKAAQNPSRRRYYVFGKNAMEHILYRCYTNWVTWSERCAADPEWAAEQQRLIVEHEEIDNLSRRSLGSLRSERSRRTYPDPLNAARSLIEIPIPEDEVPPFHDMPGNEENIPHSGPSHRADTPGGAHRAKGPSEHYRDSRTSLTSVDNAFSDVRVDTPIQTDTRSAWSTASYRKGRKGSGGRRILNHIVDRVFPSRKNSTE